MIATATAHHQLETTEIGIGTEIAIALALQDVMIGTVIATDHQDVMEIATGTATRTAVPTGAAHLGATETIAEMIAETTEERGNPRRKRSRRRKRRRRSLLRPNQQNP